ncbi:MAG: hypothetical protein K8M05_11290 [Deltaproteobacteria bacterium]|nr:hypothetical protein [Kofleriaceae bacterium]
MKLLLALCLAASLAGCKRSSQAAGPPAGQERGDCRPDRSCDPGLQCLSNLCVRPPPADCARIAEQLSFLLLDNYTPREQRTAFTDAARRQCVAAHLSADDGECITRAKHRGELRDCPVALGLGDCATITAHLEKLQSASGVDAYLVTGADRIVSRCKREVPSLAFEQCVLAAAKVEEVERCTW